MFRILSAAALASLICAGAAQAATVVVTPGTFGWSNPVDENGGGGSSAITGTAPRSGNGSVEMFGGRTRFEMGDHFSLLSNLGPLSQITSLVFDWQVAVGSTSGYHPDYTPALRLNVWDGATRSEIIWEGAYNNVYGNETKGDWYTTSATDNFYQNIGGTVTFSNGAQVNKTLLAWESSYSSSAFVSSISVGVGSGAGAGYHAFADNVTLSTATGSTTYNFETAATAVPEPATMAVLAAGVIGLGAARRRRAK